MTLTTANTDMITVTMAAASTTAANLNTIDAATGVAVGATAITELTGAAADVKTALGSAGITTVVDSSLAVGLTGSTSVADIILVQADSATGVITTAATETDAATLVTLTTANTDMITVTMAAASTDIADLNTINLATGVAVDATAVTAITDTTNVNTIDLTAAGITYHATNALTITGGAGDDNITLRAGGADTVVHAGAADGVDTITDFAFGVGADLFDFTTNLLNGGTAATSTLVAVAPMVVVNDGTASANDVIYTFSGAGDVMAGGSSAATAVANAVTALTSGTDFSSANIAQSDSLLLMLNDGTNSFLFHYVADATFGTTSAADLTLIGIFNGVQTAAIATGDII
ncbi:MAG TPA: hypothetical protein HPP95_10825 [Deltaproteobacteria bacterium]|nr:hypothetical protein [Deltaproteobacteria bacterium]